MGKFLNQLFIRGCMEPRLNSRIQKLYRQFGLDKKIIYCSWRAVTDHVNVLKSSAQHFVLDLEATRQDLYDLETRCQGQKVPRELGVFPLSGEKREYLESMSQHWHPDLRGLVRIYEIVATAKDAFYEEKSMNPDPLADYEVVHGPVVSPVQFLNFLLDYVQSTAHSLKEMKVKINKLKNERDSEENPNFLRPSKKFLPRSDKFTPYQDYNPED
jgi:hypothetical protein